MPEQEQPASGSNESVPMTPGRKTPPSPGKKILEMLFKGQRRTEEATLAAIEGLAKKIPCSPIIIEAIIYMDHEITPTMAQRLEKHLGLTAEEWLEVEKTYKGHLRWLESEGDAEAPPW